MPHRSTAPAWLEVRLTLDDAEVVDAVAEVLARFTPQPLAWEYATPQVDARNRITDLGAVTLRAYIPVGPGQAEAVQHRVAEALWHLGQIRPLPTPHFRLLRDEDWAEAWKRAYRPIPIGERLAIVPAWMTNPWPEREVIFVEPGMAFGTGMHPTTRLVLAEVERLAPGVPRVVDVGCGSGILSLAALRLGAARAVGVDTDPVAVEVARQNAARNGLGARFTARVGSIAVLLQGDTVPFGQGELVLANILAPVLVDLLRAGLARVIAPGGYGVLSGILAPQAAEVAAAAQAVGLQVTRRAHEGDWVALTLRREV